MNHKLDKPCDECPFRRKSLPGKLGPWQPETLISQIKNNDVELACHKTVPLVHSLNPGDFEDIQQCAGASIFANHICKLARNPERKAHQKRLGTDRRVVIKTEVDFLRHHKLFEGRPDDKA